MDPFSAEGGVYHLPNNQIFDDRRLTWTYPAELLNMQNAFHQGQYAKVTDFDTAALSPENTLPARILRLRARIAAGEAQAVAAELAGDDSVPDLAAVRAFAQYSGGDKSRGAATIERLQSSSSDNATVQVLGGIILQAETRSEEALSLLAKHQGNLEAVSVVVQIHLQQHRTDLAMQEVQAARRWAQDSLLVNLAESWVGIRMGGEKYQQAFYVFEELAQASATTSTKTLLGQAVAELHLGRLPEAEAAMQQAMDRDSNDADVLANNIVLSVISAKGAAPLTSDLESSSPEHQFLLDVQAKSTQFDTASAKYSAKVAS
ncbi:MAG: hypothetical protein M1817_004103 [Caeruleum heppii]|nr:MAG: hypothetical protein M1817_004103 [Caeruleum heppii]